jgi:hypothetical protein|tara:strand:+ start:105 stop:617 length:513 start_codon:yes stop_codon:yes gene_type:complete
MKKTGKKSLVKKKSLFDHIKQITNVQNPNYWEEISDEDKKSWSNYMTHRFLSMKIEWVELVNELQKYNLKPKELYKLYTNVLPKGKQWLKYTKGRNQMAHPNWLINVVANHNEVSQKEAYDMVEMYMLTEGGMLELGELCKKWGVEPKKIEKAGLNVLGSIGMYQAGNTK